MFEKVVGSHTKMKPSNTETRSFTAANAQHVSMTFRKETLTLLDIGALNDMPVCLLKIFDGNAMLTCVAQRLIGD